jgi:hypothetical protein
LVRQACLLRSAARSPIRAELPIASSCVPLQLWWSTADRIVPGQRQQTGRLFRTLRRLNPQAPVSGFVGHWPHSHEMRSDALLPLALARFRLVPRNLGRVPSQVQTVLARATPSACLAAAK